MRKHLLAIAAAAIAAQSCGNDKQPAPESEPAAIDYVKHLADESASGGDTIYSGQIESFVDEHTSRIEGLASGEEIVTDRSTPIPALPEAIDESSAGLGKADVSDATPKAETTFAAKADELLREMHVEFNTTRPTQQR